MATATAMPTAVASGARTAASPSTVGPTGECHSTDAFEPSTTAMNAAPPIAPTTDSTGRASQPFNAPSSVVAREARTASILSRRRRSVCLHVDLLQRGALGLEHLDHRGELGGVGREILTLLGIGRQIVELGELASQVDELHPGRRAVDDAAPEVCVGAVRHVQIDVAFLERLSRSGGEIS